MRKTLTEKEKLEKWLDSLVKHYKDAIRLNFFDNKVQTCIPYISGGIHIYSGVEYIAETLGLKLEYRDRDDDKYPTESFVTYKSIRFFQLNEETNAEYNL